MAKRRSIDLAAAMAADLKFHDPMSTKSHEPKSSALHENISYAPQENEGAQGHEMESSPAYETVRTSSHETTKSGKQTEAYIPPSRTGMKRIQGYFSPRVKRQFRLLAVNADITEDELVSRALNLLFRAEGLPEIAFDGKDRGRGNG